MHFVTGRFEHLDRRAIHLRLAEAREAIVEQHDRAARGTIVRTFVPVETIWQNAGGRIAASAGGDRSPPVSPSSRPIPGSRSNQFDSGANAEPR